MQTSPWIILGSTVILLIVVIVFAIQNANREKQYMFQILSAKGAALIRAVEAGARAGMMGMMWSGQDIQRLLVETGRLPDVLFMAVVDQNGIVVAHSDPSKINKPFRKGSKLIHLGPDLKENAEVVDLGNGERSFEVHRHFRPLSSQDGSGYNRMTRMMRRHGMGPAPADDWFTPQNRDQLLIVAGLDMKPFEMAAREDIRTMVLMSVIVLLIGFAGIVSLFWMYTYRSARRSLQDTSAFADKLVVNLPVGLIATDQTDRITFFNPTAEAITGCSAVAAKGRKVGDCLPDQFCGLKPSGDQWKTITDEETECTFANGQTIPLSISVAQIINDVGDFIGKVVIFRDLREVRRLEAEVRRKDKLAALGKLAAGVAHEIRNPLSSIKGMATFLSDQFSDGSEAKSAAGVMIQEVDRLNRAVSELLDFARPTDLNCLPTELAPLLTRSIQLVNQDAVKQGVRVEMDLADEICPVRIDPDRLTQCLLNLYLNAIQSMTDGGTLRVACEMTDKHYARICVSDTGPGISADHLGRIFDPYFTTKNNGTGLGLAVVHKIIDAHQAHLSVESAPGKGTTMAIRLECTSVANAKEGIHEIKPV